MLAKGQDVFFVKKIRNSRNKFGFLRLKKVIKYSKL